MQEAGHFVATCYSADEAVKVIEEYVKLPNGEEEEKILQDVVKYTNDEKMRKGIERMMMSIPNNSILKSGKIKGGVA